MAEAAACDAALPLLQAALSAAGGLIPRDFSGRVLLNINDAAGLIFSVQGGSGTASVERWSGGASRVDTTIRFDSVDSLRKALQDQSAVPMLLMRRKLRLQGDMSLMAQLGSGDVSSSSSNAALAKEFTRELDAAIAASHGATRGASVSSLRRRSLESVASLESCSTWVPNDASQCCQECSKTFNTFWRRHHCRFCGRLLCSTCAPVVQEESKDCLGVLGQSRRGKLRRCASCTAELEDGAQPARLSRRESLTSLTSDTAVEAAMERLQFLKEEVAALRKAEQRRLELAVQKGFWQIWVVTYAMIALCTLLLFCWRISIMAAWVAMLFVLHRSSESSLLQRNVRVFWSAAVVTCALLATRWKLRSLNLSEGEDYRAEWDATNEVLARFLYQQILKLKGFWIKLGQQLSVNILMEPAFRTEFGKLQDKIPPMSVSDVKLTLVEEFGAEVASTICIDEKEAPLGTASIAQVHRAIWKPKGQAHKEIVVKVQHRNVSQEFHQDLRNSQILSKLLALVDPEGVPDLRPIVQSLREVTVKELDFRQEAENQQRAMEAAEKHNARVLIPKVVSPLVSRRAMAMDYVDGEALSKASERLTQEQRNRLIGAMVDHFAVQFALDGHFHADPHPGNLLVEKGTDRLVVLDWGMCITLPPSKVHAYAELFAAAATSNPWRLMDAMRGIGITFREGDVFEPMMFLNFIRFALREAQPAEEAKGQVENFMKAGDDLYQRGPKRFKKSPFDVITGDMTYFIKALDLLWCVSSQLHTRHPILQSMFLRALATSSNIPRSPAELLPPSATAVATDTTGTALEQRLRRILDTFYRRGELLGAQLTAVRLGGGRTGSCVADVALGVDSWMRKEPITASTYFNLLDISKLIVAFAALEQLRAGRLRLTDAVRLGDAEVKVEDILSHRSGYWMPLPQQLLKLSDLQQMETVIKALRATEPGSAEQCYHSFSFGYLIAMALEDAKCPLPEAWEAVCQHGTAMAQELQLDSPALQLTLPTSATASPSPVAELEGDVTTQDFEEVAEMIGYAYAVLGENGESPSTSCGSEASRKSLFGREHLLDRSLFNLAEMRSRIMPGLQSFGTSRGLCALLCAMAKRISQDTLKSRRGDSERIQDLAEELKPLLSLEAFDDFALGVQLVHSSYWSSQEDGEVHTPGGTLQSLDSFLQETQADPEPAPAWGHLSQNGSFALVLPATQDGPLAVSLLLNLSGRKQSGPKVAKAVLRAISSRR